MKYIAFLDTVHESLDKTLSEKGFECIAAEEISKHQILMGEFDWHGIVIRSRFRIDKEIIDALPDLKFIARFGAGMENIDVEYAESKGIKCLRAPEGNMTAVAEQTLGMLLSLTNRLFIAREEVGKGKKIEG